MLKTIIKLPDGTELSSGSGSANAIQSAVLTESVNSGEELTIGSVCAGMLEAAIIAPSGGLTISAGTEVTLYKTGDSGTKTQAGIFICEKPTRKSANVFKLTAYDRVSKLDKDLSFWLAGLTGWPYTLFGLAQMVCTECGVTLKNTSLPNGDFQVNRFSAEGITGRKLLSWVGEATGKFCRATPDGKIEFAWYANSAYAIGPSADANRKCFFQGSLSYEDYQVEAIDKVQIQYSDNDVGVIHPNNTEAVNTYRITGNMLLTTDTTDRLLPIAQTVYDVLHAVTYTPAKVSILANLDIQAGQIVSATDGNGKTIKMYVMRRKQSGQRDTLECTGSRNRDSVSLVNNQSFKALSGKVLNLQTSVEGLNVKAISLETQMEDNQAQTMRQLAELDVRADGIESSVSASIDGLKSDMTQIQQDANSVAIRVRAIESDGVDKVRTKEKHFTLDDDGLRISQPGKEIENRLDETGMYVERSGVAMLQTNNNGVIASDLTARNYLKIAHARFESYGAGATACFWMQFASGQNILLDSGRTVTNNDYMTKDYIPSSPLVAGEVYTISLCVTPGGGVRHYVLYMSAGNADQVILYVNGTSRQIIRATFTARYYDGMTPADNSWNARIQLYRFPNDGTVTSNSTIHWCKVEIGDAPTDWSPAPED